MQKEYGRKRKLYALTNNGALSRAEIFTLKLKKFKNGTTIGQTTRGMLTYGSNYIKRQKLPGGLFEIYPTDMKAPLRRLPHEDHGIHPQIVLEAGRDWIEQVLKITVTR